MVAAIIQDPSVDLPTNVGKPPGAAPDREPQNGLPDPEYLRSLAAPIRDRNSAAMFKFLQTLSAQLTEAAAGGLASLAVPLTSMPPEKVWKRILAHYGYTWRTDPTNPSVIVIVWDNEDT